MMPIYCALYISEETRLEQVSIVTYSFYSVQSRATLIDIHS